MIWCLLAMPAAAASCVAVDHDRIVAADVAAAIPGFASIAPDATLGFAPLAGARRLITGRELAAFAKREGVPLDTPAAGVCVERAAAPLTAERVAAGIRTALGADDARIEVLDFSREPAPAGEIVFPAAGLLLNPARTDGSAFWRGYVKYDGQHTLAVWARIRVLARRDMVAARHEIALGRKIERGDLEIVSRELFPSPAYVSDPAVAAGSIALKNIAAGELLTGRAFETAPEVDKGDVVRVTATSGAAQITFDAIAEGRGRKGERILLLNPESHKTFHGVVAGVRCANVVSGS